MKKQTSKITIDALAAMVNKGFLEMRDLINANIDDKISDLEQKMNRRFDEVQSQLDHICGSE